MRQLEESLDEANSQSVTQASVKAQSVLETELARLDRHGETIAACEDGLIESVKAVDSVVRLLAQIHNEIDVGVGFLASTPRLFKELRMGMEVLPSPNTESGRGYVCTFIREEAQLLRRRVKVRVSILLKQSVQVDALCLRVLKSVCNMEDGDDSGASSLSLQDVWKCIRDLSDDDSFFYACINDLVEALQTTICEPIVAGGKLYSSKTSGGEHEASWVLTETPGQNRLQSFQLKLSSLTKLLEFCSQELFVCQGKRRVLGRRQCMHSCTRAATP